MKEQLTTSLDKIIALPAGTSVNLTLSGGGVKGIGHLALLDLLQERHIHIEAIAGSSAGALVGALYCSGLSTKEILDFFKSTPIFKYTWLNPSKAGIFDSEKYALIIEQYVKSYFEELKIPLTIATTNIEKNQARYFSNGNLIRPLLASCAIPAVFSPVRIGDTLHSDGGIMDNFPITPFKNDENPLIGSYVCKPSTKTKKEINTIIKVSNHSNSLLLYAANYHKFKSTYATIVFPLGEYGSFETKSIDKIYASARAYLDRQYSLKKWKELTPQKSLGSANRNFTRRSLIEIL